MIPAVVSLNSQSRTVFLAISVFALVCLAGVRFKTSAWGDFKNGDNLSARSLLLQRLWSEKNSTVCPSLENSKRILVTGAAGFIGFHVAAALQRRGDLVVGLDNFNDYYPVSLKRARQQELLKLKVPIVEADLTDMEALNGLFRQCSFTHVVHLAAQAGVRYAKKKPMSYVNSNVVGSVTLLEVLRSQPERPILVYASSSSVYGLNKHVPFSEADRVDQPASLYAATKRSQELLTFTYHNIYNLSTTGLRFFTVYGPWGRPDMSIYSFTRNILEGKPIRVFKGPGGSELARDFTFVEDITAGVLGALDSAPRSAAGEASFRLFNLGNTRTATVSEMVGILQHQLGKKAVVNEVPVPNSGDVLVTNANISAAMHEFGYAPSTNLETGIKKFSEWYFSYYGPHGDQLRADEIKYVPD